MTRGFVLHSLKDVFVSSGDHSKSSFISFFRGTGSASSSRVFQEIFSGLSQRNPIKTGRGSGDSDKRSEGSE
ncbi:hypothetical protein AO388_25825 [Pseudomonas sp. ICMP 10191]|nr:hypothetical protein AO388_25825 [Pseudomonas sp. ICMP 10191]